MTDQAVDTDGAAAGGAVPSPAGAVPEPAAAPFVGRLRELRELRADIDRAGLDTLSGRKAPRARVLLVAGRPGSGRTSLAEALVRKTAGEYPDGVLRARLTDPDGTRVSTERTARTLLDALDVPAPPGAHEDELAEILRGALAERRALLLLDDAADAEQVEPLLPDTPDCLVVAVSEGPVPYTHLTLPPNKEVEIPKAHQTQKKKNQTQQQHHILTHITTTTQ
ncbi:AAA family ATPase, partial [Streptomyces alfalfae]